MGYIAKRQGSAQGLYRFLERAEEGFFEAWLAGQGRRVENGYGAEGYPRQRRLDAFEAGAPVNVSSGEVLGWGAVQAGAPHVQRPAGRAPERAVVRPDDSVVFTNDGWLALWLEENGI